MADLSKSKDYLKNKLEQKELGYGAYLSNEGPKYCQKRNKKIDGRMDGMRSRREEIEHASWGI
jgi:hypothetical protein